MVSGDDEKNRDPATRILIGEHLPPEKPINYQWQVQHTPVGTNFQRPTLETRQALEAAERARAAMNDIPQVPAKAPSQERVFKKGSSSLYNPKPKDKSDDFGL